MAATAGQPEGWQKLPGEPTRWYARFEQYRLLGPRRTLEQAFGAAKEAESLTGGRAGTQWYAVARAWRWQARAEAWDEAERAEFLKSEKGRRLDARRRRLEMIEAAQEQAYAALLAADLGSLAATDLADVAQARELLAATRLLLMDALKAQRLEYGEATEVIEQGALFTADDLAAAEAELAEWRKSKVGPGSG